MKAKLIVWSKGVYARLVLGALGIGALFWLVQEAGQDAVRDALVQASAFIPLLLLLEGARIACEGLATYRLAGQERKKLPLRALLRAQLVAYSICIVAPAGRTAGEAVKGAMLSPYIGTGRATVIASTIQALTLLANGTVALAGAVVAFVILGGSVLTWALVAYALVTWGGAALIQVASRSRRLCGWMVARAPRFGRSIVRFRRTARDSAYVPLGPACAILGARLLQAVQFGILAGALGMGFGITPTLLGQGVSLVSGAVGDLIPAQIGVTDSAFALASASLGTTAAIGLSIAVLIHCVQLLWVALGATIPMIYRAKPMPPQNGSRPSAAPRREAQSSRGTRSRGPLPVPTLNPTLPSEA